jgi:peptidoglycan/LPS O-acetylase OafA/YrhL
VERNRLVDGWRGVSVLLVIFGHLIGSRFGYYFETRPFHNLLSDQPLDVIGIAKNVILRVLLPFPGVGVSIFFVISGYLITGLLLKEEASRGSISIGAFYVRRVFRIIPAFYTYLIAIFIISAFGALEVPNTAFIWSGLFLCNVSAAPCTWFLGHTWSLSVEEQFYLIWPIAFFVLGQRWRITGLGLILVGLFVTSYFVYMAIPFLYIAIGSLFALSEGFRNAIIKVANRNVIAAAAVVIVSAPFFASLSIHYIIDATEPILIAVVFFGTVNGVGPFVRLVSIEWIRLVGLVSYSMYLWQQLSTGPPDSYRAHSLLLFPFLFIAPAILSYWLVEKPMIRMGHRLSDAIKAQRRSAEAVTAKPS